MAKGRKTGGRTRGTPNKATSRTAHVFAALGGVEGEQYAAQLHRLACGQHDDPHVRVKALNIIRDYLPWTKTADRLELTGEGGSPFVVRFVDA
jgi:hypothetical protein